MKDKMALDKTTFGDTPAAMFLATRLNEVNNVVLTRKISRSMQHYRNIMRDARLAHEGRSITTQTLSWIVSRLNDQLNQTVADMCEATGADELSIDLMSNVIRGEIKRIINKARQINHIERQQRNIGMKETSNSTDVRNANGVLVGYEKTTFHPITPQLVRMKDPKTSVALQKKSAAKLKAAGKPNTLY